MSGSRQRQAEATRARILAAAAEQFAEHGRDGARVERIAARAGVNKERLYRYFGDKAGLFDAAVADAMEQIVAAEPFAAGDLGSYVMAMVRFHRRHPTLVRLLLAEARSGAEPAHREDRLAHYGVRAAAVAEAQAAGIVRDDVDPRLVVLLVQALVVTVEALPDVSDLILGAPAPGRDGPADLEQGLADLLGALRP